LRELKALVEFDNELWAAKMRDCLRDACLAVGEARAKGETALSPAALQTFHARYFEALREGKSLKMDSAIRWPNLWKENRS
jgi:hypothetical protein